MVGLFKCYPTRLVIEDEEHPGKVKLMPQEGEEGGNVVLHDVSGTAVPFAAEGNPALSVQEKKYLETPLNLPEISVREPS